MADENKKINTEYGAESIKVMEGLEAVRKRPAMYIGSTGVQGLHHLVYEVVDNSVDEALAGHCDSIKVKLHLDGSCSVEDNGRGIPTDIHSTEKVSAAQVVLTKLHAGGKFDKQTYKFSGGLHGVGISVVNALSEYLELEIYRNGKIYKQLYKKSFPQGPLEIVGDTTKRGTYVHFKPDTEIFEVTTFSFDTLSSRFRELAFLNRGLKIKIDDEINNKHNEFYFEGGIVSFVQHVNNKKTPLFPEVIHFEREDEKYILEVALQYNDGFGEQVFSFVNNINTIEGGTHVAGFKSALTKACNKRAQAMGMLKGEEGFSSEDVREGLVAVVNIKVPEPQFEGQTKAKLGNSEVKGIVDSWLFAYLDTFFEENPTLAKKILQKAEIAKRARDAAKKARDLARRKTVLESSVLPGKLADCSDENPENTELFIVEGDSAGGSAKGARDRNTQAVLPLKGKILNVEKARLDKILSNEEIKAIISAVGGGVSEDFDLEKVRYHKIILMTDADVDGSHIRTLLLTFFFRYMRPIIEKGYLYIAQPPLYKAKIGKKEQYLKDDSELKQFLLDWARENILLLVNGKEFEENKWHKLLNDLDTYESSLNNLASDFKLATDTCHDLLVFLYNNPIKEEDVPHVLLSKLQEHFKQYSIGLREEEIPGGIDSDVPTINRYISFKMLAREWNVPVEFFTAPEVMLVLKQLEPLEVVEKNECSLKIKDRERSLSVKGVSGLIHGISDISKPYMTIQRYKGLGEMNPDQLGETAMDKTSRSLLKVKIEDALEADAWFATLMGDDIQGRKQFIEENGRFVKNLDI